MVGIELVQKRSGFTVTFEKFNNIPVVGIELNPTVEGVDEDSLRFTWYRLLCDRKLKCSVHKLKDAALQCISCAKSDLHLEESYHCSVDCYKYSRNDLFLVREEVIVDQDGKSWVKVADFKNYVPSKDDFGFILRLETVGVDFSCHLDTDRVIVAPSPCSPRCIIPIPRQSFKVLSYNLLADMYVTPNKFGYCRTWALTWEYRKQNLLREIIRYDADIICLQEVQLEHFENFLKPELQQRGYSVIYMSKQEAIHMRGRYRYDGCATFYRCNRFREVRGYQLVFKDFARAFIQALHINLRDGVRLLKDNVAIVTILESLEDKAVSCNQNSIFCVANTHIHANENFKDVKLWQVATLINGLEIIDNLGIPILICGDLNSRPGSAPYDLLLHGNVNYQHAEWPNDPIGIFNYVKLFHGVRLESAYRSSPITDGRTNSITGEPQFTNFSNDFSGTLDYIFYSEDKLMVKSLLELLDPRDISKNTGLPSPDWSSDHIALMAEFYLIPWPKVCCMLPECLWWIPR